MKSKFIEIIPNIDTIKALRQEVKKYIETADEKVVKMIHPIPEVDTDNNWLDSLPDEIKTYVGAALAESEKGEMTAHADIQKCHKKSLVK